jgi:hypothetical protein
MMFDLTRLNASETAPDGGAGGTGNGYMGLLQGGGMPPVDRQSMLAGLMMSLGQAFANQGRMRPMQSVASAIGSVGAAGRDDPQRMTQMWQASQQMREQQRRNQTREWLVRNAARLGIADDVVDKLDDAMVAEVFRQFVRSPKMQAAVAVPGGTAVTSRPGGPSSMAPPQGTAVTQTTEGVSGGYEPDPMWRWRFAPFASGFRDPREGAQ